MKSLNNGLSRRELLQAAGGVTLVALAPRLGLAATDAPVYEVTSAPGRMGTKLPVFTALPYLQPGPSSKLVDGQEAIVVAWQTDAVDAKYELHYGLNGYDQVSEIAVAKRFIGTKEDVEDRLNYSSRLNGLKLGTKYRYRVAMDGSTLLEGFFTTRKPRGTKTRFVSFGDNSFGDMSDRAIAFQTYRAMPDFVLNAGDNVYDSGLDDEYARYFFPVYNADQAAVRVGAPLLRAVPFYTVLANHDCHDKDDKKGPCADFTKNPDSLAYFTNMHLPLNGPDPTKPLPMIGDPKAIEVFRKAAGDRYPRMANYSFDYGDGHFLCIDSNIYLDTTDQALQTWIDQDLAQTDAAWKFVVYHHPAFNVGKEHYDEQHMRVLAPIFEKHGVTFVFSGHEHNYQRTMPLHFAPKSVEGARKVGDKMRRIPGEFTIDRMFDGNANRKPNGVIYLTTGAGGKHLYDAEINQNPKEWLHEPDGNVDYVTKVVSDRHSITVIDMDAKSLTIRQVDEWGGEVDLFHISK